MTMAWVYLLGLALVLWGVCGATMAIGRKVWSLDATLRVHLAVAPIVAFLVSTVHKYLTAEFDPLLRAVVMTGVVVILDACVVAPIFERSYAMFRSFIGTWIPFAAIFLASWAAAILPLS
jgi:hypothetical protein